MKRTRGNILFLILLAVVLFAALSYAITQSIRGGGKDGGSESAEARASALLNHLTNMDTAIARMRLSGVRDEQINFFYGGNHNALVSNQDNSNCTESRCRVFDPNGGGVPILDVSFYRSPSSQTGEKSVSFARMPQVGTSEADIVFEFNGISYDMCKAINAKAGLPMLFNQASFANNVNGIGPYRNNSVTPYPVGPIPSLPNDWTVPVEYARARTFCYCQSATEAACRSNSQFNPRLIHILVER